MKKLVSTSKFLIVLMFWDGDKPQAMKLARLLADLEKGHSDRADFLFVSRFDCEMDPKVFDYVSRKFNVFQHRSKRRGTGWPNGCNSIFFGALEWVYHKIAAGHVQSYKSILILGPDGAPLRRDWVDYLSHAWDTANHHAPVVIAGALVPPYEGLRYRDHINGDCAMLSGDLRFLKWLTIDVGDVSTHGGWDWLLAHEFEHRGWCNFPFVKSAWRSIDAFKQEDWDREVAAGTVWFHGQKGDSLLEVARDNLLWIQNRS